MFLNRLKPTLIKISAKLALAYSLVLILSSVVIISVLYFKVTEVLKEQEIEALAGKIDDLKKGIEREGDKSLDSRDPQLLVAIFSATEMQTYLRQSSPELDINPEYLKDEVFAKTSKSFTFEVESQKNQIPALVSGQILNDGSRVIVAKSLQGLMARRSKIQNMYWWIFLPIIFLGFLGGIFLSDRTLRPVHELLTSMKKVAGGSLATRVPLGSGDNELEELKFLCNKMLDKIENLVNGLKEAFDHLAHDIRTPVTRLRGRAELALNAQADTETYREALLSCFENSDRILTFLQVLTDITEAENRSRKLKLEKKYISDLVREVMSLYEMSFDDKGIRITQNLDSNDWALVDSKLISRVIANLLDNAHKYTPSGGEVIIETKNQTESVLLKVTDTGPGIATEEQSLVWQKLYRSDKSRSQHGMGLGLTFVKAVVEAHDGKVSVRSPVKDGRGTEFEVYLQKMS